MVSNGYEHEEARRKHLRLPTLRWYLCHGCGMEYSFQAGVRGPLGCSNPKCNRADIHIHSDLDGERPTTL